MPDRFLHFKTEFIRAELNALLDSVALAGAYQRLLDARRGVELAEKAAERAEDEVWERRANTWKGR